MSVSLKISTAWDKDIVQLISVGQRVIFTIQRERDRERERVRQTDRQREREREREALRILWIVWKYLCWPEDCRNISCPGLKKI